MGLVWIFLQRRGSSGRFDDGLVEVSGWGSQWEPGLFAVVFGSDAGTKRHRWTTIARRFHRSLLSAKRRIQHECQQFDATDAESLHAVPLGSELHRCELDRRQSSAGSTAA